MTTYDHLQPLTTTYNHLRLVCLSHTLLGPIHLGWELTIQFVLPHSAQRKDLPYPKGMKDGPKSGCIFSLPASQPTAYLTIYLKWNISATTDRIFPNIKLKLKEPNRNWKLPIMKTTYTGRWPQNIKTGISQQPLIGSSSNFKLYVLGPV